MISAIREIRRAKGLTLADVAARCSPPTTAQTIGRLETGTRTVSVGWLNRIAAALGVTAADLVQLPDRVDVPVSARLDRDGARAPTRPAAVAMPRPAPGMVSVIVDGTVGDYRAGDELWCAMVEPAGFADALNRDVLVPRAAGRFAFGRLIGRDGARLQILPPASGSRQQVIPEAPWLAVATMLIRKL